MKYACSTVVGASKSRLSWLMPDASTSSIRPNLSPPSGRQMPDFPLCGSSPPAGSEPATTRGAAEGFLIAGCGYPGRYGTHG